MKNVLSRVYQLVMLSVVFCCLTLFSFAQFALPEVIASAGGHTSTATHSVSWTIGEAVVDTYSSAVNILTKGFHQPQMIPLAGIENAEYPYDLSVFPNPVNDQLCFDLSKMEKGEYGITICDVTGQVVKKHQFEWKGGKIVEKVAVSDLAPGVYLVRIHSGGKDLRVTRIIKY